jgi:uncharacterized MAPEG superfamily protein
MTVELRMLLFSSCLGIIQIMLAAAGASKVRGLSWALSSRDKNEAPLPPAIARLDRAQKNFFETFPVFVAAVLTAQLLHVSNGTTVLGAELYFGARVLYVPIYTLGIPVVRTLVWTASIVGIILVLAPQF